MQASSEFPLEVLPLVTVRTVEEAKRVAKGDFDVQVIYAARRDLPVLEALADNDKWNLMFVRHRSGPLYYMYIGSHPHFLRKRRDEFGQRNMGVHDIVVDDHAELLWRLQVFYALKNLRKKRVVAVGGAGGWGADGNLAPERARELWSMDICHVTYPELGERIKNAQKDPPTVRRALAAANRYLAQPGVKLETVTSSSTEPSCSPRSFATSSTSTRRIRLPSTRACRRSCRFPARRPARRSAY